jgi:FlaA1/EpsC-like NDP-sugar epimerase
VQPDLGTRANGNQAAVAFGRRRPPWLRQHIALLVFLDAVAAGGATAASRLLGFGVDEPGHIAVRSLAVPYAALAVATVPTWIAVLAMAGCYDVGPFGTPSREPGKVVRAAASFLAVLAVGYFVLHLEEVGRDVLAPIVPLAVAATLLLRVLARLLLHERRRRGHALRRAVVVGSRSRVDDLARHLDEHRSAGLLPVAACVPGDRSPLRHDGRAVPILGGVESVLAAVHEIGADSVVVAGNLGSGQVRSLTWALEGRGIDVLIVPTPAETELMVEPRPVAGLPLLYVDQSRSGGPAEGSSGTI